MALLAIVLAAAQTLAPVHLPVSTNDAPAQAAFDRGLFLYYAYNGTDAARAFTEAIARDPGLATAYWGVALANGPDLNTPQSERDFDVAARAIAKAQTLAAHASQLERSLIAAMALRYHGTFANWHDDDAAYRRAMLALAQASHDETAEMLAAEALLEAGGLAWNTGRLASSDSQTAMELVENVLRDDPGSVMANHLCIHLYDLATDRSPALPCAQRLDGTDFPPEAEHLAHMPAHYWIETGAYAAALRSSERAYALMTALEAADRDSEHASRYAKHDVAVGYSAAMMLGNYATAQLWCRRMNAVFEIAFDAVTALRFGRYDAAFAVDGNQLGGSSVRGLAALALGRVADARALAEHVSTQRPDQGYLPQLFLGRLAEANGRYDEAERWLRQSITNETAQFAGELIPLIPAGEALGSLRLRHADNRGAIDAFTATLATYPNDPRALYGVSRALAADGQSAEAASAQNRFKQEWKGADTSVSDALP